MGKYYSKSASLSILFICFSFQLYSQKYFPESGQWIEIAEQLKPVLKESIIYPVGIVDIVENKDAFQGWERRQIADMDSVYNNSFKAINNVLVDFGDHFTGYFSFDLETVRGTSDAPVRFKLTFGEVPSEMVTPFDPYSGTLSRAWLQDEVVTVMSVPARFTLDRRVSFRYLKIELLGSSRYFDFRISNMELKAVTSAGNQPKALSDGTSEMIREIDRISMNTLKECMQTVYEDGPKRDQRLWVGDMYLESLANKFSFNNHQLTKRCLYLFAGLTDGDGYVLGTVFEEPEPHAQAGQRLMDYSLLFNVTLKEYFEATNDTGTANALWPVAQHQLTIIDKYVTDGMVDYQRANREWWLFFDWKRGLNKQASIQGLMMFVLQNTYELAQMLNKQEEVKTIPPKIKKLKEASLKDLYNSKTGLFESGADRQISYASQVWMILGGALNKDQSQRALTAVMNNDEALHPGGPYMYHYFIQALVNAGMVEEAKTSLTDYWGSMIKKGADTFWEVYDPENDFISPYNAVTVNSYCHAWSCTPVYFIRKYPDIFQN